MTSWIALLFTVGIVLVVLIYPFCRRRTAWMPFRAAAGEDLYLKKEALLRAMKDVEFEYENGTLSEDDRTLLMAEYKRKAMAVMERLEQAGGSEEARGVEALEAEIASERRDLEAE